MSSQEPHTASAQHHQATAGGPSPAPIALFCLLAVAPASAVLAGTRMGIPLDLMATWLWAIAILAIGWAAASVIALQAVPWRAWFGPCDTPTRLLTALGIAAAGCSWIVLGLGEAGLLSRASLTLVFLAMVAGAMLAMMARRSNLTQALPSAPKGTARQHSALALLSTCALAAFVAAWLVFAFAPPHAYDVLEYHLGGPVTWLDNGNTHPLIGNFYTGLPSSLEMLFTFAMAVNPHEPMIQAKLVHVAAAILYLAATMLLLRSLNLPLAWQLSAAVILASQMPVFRSVSDANNDLGAAALYTLALAHVLTSGPTFGAGLLVGLAMGMKFNILTVGMAAITPVVLFHLLAGRSAASPRPASAIMQSLALMGLGAAIGFLPWAARATAHYGMPLFPSAAITIPGLGDPLMWSAVQANAYTAHHHVSGPHQLLYWLRLPGRLWAGGGAMLGLILMTLAACGMASLRRTPAIRLAGVLSLAYFAGIAAWNILGTSPDRFLISVYPLAVASGLLTLHTLHQLFPALPVRSALAVLLVATALPAMVAIALSAESYGVLHAAFRQRAAMADSSIPFTERFIQGWPESGITTYLEEAQANRPESSTPLHVFCLYEARIAAIPVAATTVTVHDALPLEWWTLQGLIDAGFTHIVVNEFELERLRQFYPTEPHRNILQLPNSPNRQHPGTEAFYLDWTPWMLAAQIATANGVPWDRQGPELLRELPRLRDRAARTNGALGHRGHQVWIIDLSRPETRPSKVILPPVPATP